MAEESTTTLSMPRLKSARCSQKPSRPASKHVRTGASAGSLKRTFALAISSCSRLRSRAGTERKRGFSAAAVAQAISHLSQPSSSAMYRVPVVVVLMLRSPSKKRFGVLPDGDLYHLRYLCCYMVSNDSVHLPGRLKSRDVSKHLYAGP